MDQVERRKLGVIPHKQGGFRERYTGHEDGRRCLEKYGKYDLHHSKKKNIPEEILSQGSSSTGRSPETTTAPGPTRKRREQYIQRTTRTWFIVIMILNLEKRD